MLCDYDDKFVTNKAVSCLCSDCA